MTTSCSCLGYEVVFECVVLGDGATVWQGTALKECMNSRIVLRHSEFFESAGHNISQTCGASGQVVGRTISVVNDSFISQLTINASLHVNGSTIKCASDNETQVGSRQILLTTGCLLYTSPSPRDATLSRMPSSA